MKFMKIMGLSLLLAVTFCAKHNVKSAVVTHENLIFAEDLNNELQNNTNLVIIDVRPDAKFALGHIPNSRQVWRPDIQLSEKEVGYDGMRVTPEGLAKVFGELGIDNNTDVVIYGDNGNLDASRLYWLANMYGHKNLRMLSGGWKAWKDANLSSEVGGMAKNYTAKKYDVKPVAHPQDNVTFDEVKQIVASNNPEYVILDTRSEGEYTGKQLKKGAFLKGHIPNAVWIEWTQALDENEQYKSLAELKKLYEEHGITPDKKIIVYCQSGVRSAHTFFVLKELLGYDNVQNYDGSWIEWSYQAQNNNAPVTGA